MSIDEKADTLTSERKQQRKNYEAAFDLGVEYMKTNPQTIDNLEGLEIGFLEGYINTIDAQEEFMNKNIDYNPDVYNRVAAEIQKRNDKRRLNPQYRIKTA